MKGKSGFTLLEILLSITILSLLMIVVYNIVTSSTQKKDELTAEDRDRLQVETAMQRIELDFSQIYSPLYFTPLRTTRNAQGVTSPNPGFEPSEKFPAMTTSGEIMPSAQNPDRSTLIFLTAANRRKVENVKQSIYAWVKYGLQNASDPDHPSKAPFDLVRQFDPNNPYSREFHWDELKPQVLLRGVKSLDFFFWNSIKEDFSASTMDLENKNLLRGLKAKLVWIDIYKREQTFERVFRPLWPFFNADKEQAKLNSATPAPGSAAGEEGAPGGFGAGAAPSDSGNGAPSEE